MDHIISQRQINHKLLCIELISDYVVSLKISISYSIHNMFNIVVFCFSFLSSYMILKEAYQCQNQHKFCYGCIYTWSTGPTTGHDSCPVCRCDGLYAKNYDVS